MLDWFALGVWGDPEERRAIVAEAHRSKPDIEASLRRRQHEDYSFDGVSLDDAKV